METERKKPISHIAELIVKLRVPIAIAFLALVVFSVFSIRWIKVENDITFYLPEEAEARQGLEIMDEFTTYGTAKVMVRNITAGQAEALKEKLSKVPDVLLVLFDRSEQHYKNSTALFDITFADVEQSERSERALAAVLESLSGYDVTWHSAICFSLSALLAEQMGTVLIFVVIVVLAVLIFTSSTFAEIPVMILTFLVAAVINIGTHFLLGTISFVSNSVGIVLQLALSVDYAIIFCNRYKEERERLEIREAVVKALSASIPEIFASSLTTIAGLTAMTLMKFRLGADMGLTLIKSILCSLLTVFLFMPSLLMLFGRAMDKTKHRRFVPKISFVGRFAYATRRVFPILFLLLVIGAYAVFSQTRFAYSVDLVPAFRQTELEAAKAEIEEIFGKSNAVAVLVPSGDYASEKKLLRELEACEEVKTATGLTTIEISKGVCIGDEVDTGTFSAIAGVDDTTAKALFAYYAAEKGEHRVATGDLSGYQATLLDLFLFLHERLEAGELELPEDQTAMINQLFTQLGMVQDQLQSERYSRLILDLNLPTQSEETFAFLNRIHSLAARYYPDGVLLTGNAVSALGFRDSFSSDNLVVGLMSLVLVMIILFFTFKSFGMPLLLILVIQGSIWINFAIATLKGDHVFFLCYLIVSAIQMGANIDYAIVVSSRYQEFRRTMDRKEAIITTLNLAFPTVITSGLMMVCAGLLIGFGVSQCIIAGMGYYVGTGTSISLALILFALPQVLLLGDRFVAATTVKTENSAFLGFLARNRRRFAALFLTAAAVFALITAPAGYMDGIRYEQSAVERSENLLAETAELRALAKKLEREGSDIDALMVDFAEQLVTDEVGSGLLEEGQAEYDEGLAAYNAGAAMIRDGEAQLAEAQARYDAGVAELADAQARYDAGVAAYSDGQARYETAKQQLAEGQAKYDEGLAAYNAGQAQYEAGKQRLAEGQAQYDAALAEYNSAKSALDAVAPLVNRANALKQETDNLQAQYDEAVANGDTAEALRIGTALAAARYALDAQMGGTSINQLLAQYQDAQARMAVAEQQLAEGKAALDNGYAQLAVAEQQLAESEQQLAAGKAALDDGYAQLAVAEQQLSDAEQQLTTGKAALDNGYAQLAEGSEQIEAGKNRLADAYRRLAEGRGALAAAEQELEAGREQLAENLTNLNDSLAALDQYQNEQDRLRHGLDLLSSDPGVKALLGRNPGTMEILDVAENYFRSLITQAETQNAAARYFVLALAVAAGLALLSLLLFLILRKHPLPAALTASLAALLGGLCFFLWRSRCSLLTGRVPLAAALLAVLAAVFAALLFGSRKKAPSAAAAVPAATEA